MTQILGESGTLNVQRFALNCEDTEAEKGQSKNILQIPKNILNRNVFSKINVEEFAKSKKNITNPKKIIGSTNKSSNNPKIFCKSIKTISNRNFCINHY